MKVLRSESTLVPLHTWPYTPEPKPVKVLSLTVLPPAVMTTPAGDQSGESQPVESRLLFDTVIVPGNGPPWYSLIQIARLVTWSIELPVIVPDTTGWLESNWVTSIGERKLVKELSFTSYVPDCTMTAASVIVVQE